MLVRHLLAIVVRREVAQIERDDGRSPRAAPSLSNPSLLLLPPEGGRGLRTLCRYKKLGMSFAPIRNRLPRDTNSACKCGQRVPLATKLNDVRAVGRIVLTRSPWLRQELGLFRLSIIASRTRLPTGSGAPSATSHL